MFSRRRPVDPGFGRCLYDANEQIVFSILTPIVRPLGTFRNGAYTGVSLAGRAIAHIPQQRSNSIELNFTVGNLGSCTTTGTSGNPNTPGYEIRRQDLNSTTFVACGGGSLSADGKSVLGPSTPFGCSLSTSSAPGNTYSRQPNYRSLIIDVTNY